MKLRAIAIAFVLLALTPRPSGAVTVEDLVALSKAGLADSVLVAVIDADRTVFNLTPQQVIELKNAGVPPAIIVKMLGTPREFAEPNAEPSPVVVIGDDPAPGPTYVAPETAVIVPFYVPVPVVASRLHRHAVHEGARRVERPQAGHPQAFVQPSPLVQPRPFVQPAPFVQPRPFVQPSINSSGQFINDGWVPGLGFGRFINH